MFDLAIKHIFAFIQRQSKGGTYVNSCSGSLRLQSREDGKTFGFSVDGNFVAVIASFCEAIQVVYN